MDIRSDWDNRRLLEVEPDLESDDPNATKFVRIGSLVGVVGFTVGHVNRLYGGPEEGGWYWDQFTPQRVIMVPRRRRHEALARIEKVLARANEQNHIYPLHSVLSNGRQVVRDHIQIQPDRRPIYS